MYLNTLITRPFLSIYGTNIVGHMGYTSYHYHNHIQSFYKTPTTYTASTPTAMVTWLFQGSSIIVGGLIGSFLGVISPLTYGPHI